MTLPVCPGISLLLPRGTTEALALHLPKALRRASSPGCLGSQVVRSPPAGQASRAIQPESVPMISMFGGACAVLLEPWWNQRLGRTTSRFG